MDGFRYFGGVMYRPVVLALLCGTVLSAGGDSVKVSAEQTVCLPSSVCVPVSVLETEFTGYEAGQPAPLLVLRQELIDTAKGYADALQKVAALQGELGAATAQLNAQRVSTAQTELDALLATACGKESVWNKEQRRCVPKVKKDSGK